MTADSFQDLTREHQAAAEFRDAILAAAAANDAGTIMDAIAKRAKAVTCSEAARLWLSAADEWVGADPDQRRNALENAVAAAAEDEALFAFLARSFDAAGDPVGIEATLRVAVDRTPEDVEAHERLGAFFIRSGNTDAAVQVAETLASHSESGAVVALSLVDSIGLEVDSGATSALVLEASRKSGNERRLLQALEARFRSEPNDSGNIAEYAGELVSQCLAVTGDHEAAFSTLDDAWSRAPGERTSLYRRADELVSQSGNTALGSRMAELAEEVERWPEVVRWQRWLADAAEAPYRKAKHLLAAGDVLALRTGQVSEALEAYSEAARLDSPTAGVVQERLGAMELNLAGEDRAAVSAARSELLGARGDYVQLHDVLIQRVADATGETRPGLLFELASLQLDKLGRPDLAVIALGEAAGAESLQDETRASVIEMLIGLLELESAAERAAVALIPLQETDGNLDNLARALEVAATQARNGTDRANYFDRLAATHLKREDREAAADALSQANAENPAGGYSPRLREILTELGRFDDALGLVQREIDTGAPDAQTGLHLAQADLFVAAGRPGDAISTLHYLGDDGRVRFAELVSADGGAAAAGEAADAQLADGRPASASAILWDAAAEIGLDEDAGVQLATRAAQEAALTPERWSALVEATASRSEEERISVHRALLTHGARDPGASASQLALGQLLAATDPQAAEDAFVAVIDTAPDSEEALDGLFEIVRARGDAGPIVQVLEHRLEHLTLSEEDAVAHLSEIVDLYVETLGRPDLAFPFCRSILQFDPSHERALSLVEEGTSDDLGLRYEVLCEGLEELSGSALSARHSQLAELSLKLEAPKRAASHRTAAAGVERLPDEERVAAARVAAELGFSLGDAGVVLESFALEVPVLTDERGPRAEEIIDRLADIGLDHALQAATTALDGWNTPEGGVLDRHAQLARRSGDHAAAAQSLATWLDRDGDGVPGDRRAQLALDSFAADATSDESWQRCAEALARDPGQIDLVMKVEELRGDGTRVKGLAAAIATTAEEWDADERIPALYRAAELAAPEDEAQAESYWTDILSIRPDENRALDFLRGALKERGDGAGESELLRERLVHLEGESRVPVLRELADLAEGNEAVEAAHLAVLEADATIRASRVALADLYERSESYQKAIDILGGHPGSTPEERREFQARIAALSTDKLSDVGQTIAAFEAMVEDDVTDEATLVSLTKLYVGQEEWHQVAATLERLAGLQSDEDRKARILERLAGIYEKRLEQLSKAADAWSRVVALEPGNISALEEVARLHEASEAWDKFVNALDQIANAANIPGLRQEILMRAAPVLLEKLERPGDALNLFGQAIAGGAHANEETLARLSTAAEQAGDWASWCNTLRHIAQREEDEEKRTEHDLAIADALSTKIGDHRAAVVWLAECIAQNPVRGPLLARAEEIADANDLEAELVETYKLLTANNAEEPETIWHALDRSRALAEKLGHPDTAFGIMCRAAETPELNERATLGLERLAKEHGLWAEYASFLEDPNGEDDATARAVRQAEVQAKELDDWQSAFETLMAAFQDAPFDERVTNPLYALAEAHEAWPFVAKLLELLQEDAEGDTKARYLSEIASVYGDRLGNASDAFAQELRAWQVSPRDPELRARLEGRAKAAEREVDLLAAFEWLTKQPGSEDETAEAFDLAAALSVRLGLVERALALFAAKAISSPGELESVLDAARESLAAHPGAIANVGRTLAAEGDAEIGTRALVLCASFESEAETRDEEIALLRAAIAIAGRPGDVRPQLLDALRRAGDAAPLAAELENRLVDPVEDEEKRAVTAELRDLYRDSLGDMDRATAMGRRLMELDPNSGDARASYEAQLRDLERWPELVEHLLKRADAEEDAGAGSGIRLEAAAIAEEYLDDSRRAMRIANEVLEHDASNARALELKARGLAAMGRWQDHIDTLVLLAAASDPTAAARVFAQAAEVYEHHLAYADKALAMWSDAAAADPEYGHAFAEQARLSTEVGDHEMAFSLWSTAVEKLEGRALAEALVNLAQAAPLAGAEFDVLGTLKKAVEIDSRNPLARSAYEDALLESGDLDAIMALLDRELEAAEGEERGDVYMRRAAIQFFDGHNESNALKSIDAAIEAGVARAASALRGDFHLVGGRWEEAVSDYRIALGDDDTLAPRTLAPRLMFPGEDPARHAATTILLFRAGYASEASGRYNDAQDFYAGANLEDEAFAPAAVGLARLAFRQGNHDGAALYISAYRAAGPGVPELDAEVLDLATRLGLT